MAGEPLEEQLVLDISPALASIGLVDDALGSVISNFSSGLSDAFSSFTAVPVDIPVTADTSQAEQQVAAAGLDAPQTVPVDADTQNAEAAVATLDAPLTVPVDGDVTQASQAIGGLGGEQVTVDVTADTTEAVSSINDLGAAATDAIGASGAGGVDGLSSAVNLAKGAAGAAGADFTEVAASLKEIGGAGTGAALGGGAAIIGFLGESIHLAADAQAVNKNFAATFGDLASQIERVNVGGLNVSLAELAKQSGTSSTDLEAAAIRIGQLGTSSGASNDQIVKTTTSILALGSTFSVTNPRLGDAATVSDNLTNALARGGRFLSQYGVSLNATDINLRAMQDTGKTTAAELTQFEKTAAGAELATAQFGDTLGTKFASGAQNAQVQLRALKVQVQDSLVAIGTPLLEPAVKSLQDFLPVAVAVGQALGSLAQAFLPLVADVTPALIPLAAVIGAVGQGVTVLSDAVGTLSPATLIAIAAGLGFVAVSSGEAAAAIAGLTVALDTNPLFLGATVAILALATLGGAFNVFHSESQTVQVDAHGLASALLESATAADVLAGKTANLSNDLADQLRKTLDVGPANQKAIEGANQLGQSYDFIATQLLGTREAFVNYTTDLLLSVRGTKDQQLAQLNLLDALGSSRAALEANASAALAAAVAQGFITQSQVDQIPALDGVVVGYERLKPTIEAAAEAQRKQALSTAQTTGELQRTIAAFNPAAESADAYTKSLVALGITQSEADTLAKDQTASFAEVADQTILASDAAQQLNVQFLAGTITAGELEGQLVALGVSVTGAKGDVTGLSGAMKSFLDTAGQAVPGAKAALDDYTHTVEADFKAATDAQQKHESTAKGLFEKLATDADPTTFTANILKQIAAIEQFQNVLKLLVAEGAPDLAAFFAQQGAQSAGGIAAGFASDPAKAKISEGVFAAGDSQKTAYLKFLKENFAPEVAAAAAQAAGIIAQAGTPDLPGAVGSAAQGAQAALFGAVPGLQKAGSTASASATAGFEAGFQPATAAQQGISAAQQVLQSEVGIVGTSHTLGQLVGLAFDGGIVQGIQTGQFAIQIAAAAAAAAAAASARAALGVKSPSTVGITIGEQFVAGIAQGLSNVTPVTTAAAGIGDALAGAVNPVVPNFVIPVGNAGAQSSSGPSSIALDLVVHLQDGSVVNVPTQQITIPQFRSTLAQRVKAEVQAG